MSTAAARDHGLLGQLAEVAVSGATGVLTAVRGKHRRLFCFEHGALIYAVSNVVEEQFGQTLIQRKAMTEDAVRAAAHQAERQGKKLGAFLAGEEFLPRETLDAALTEHARYLLGSTSRWTGGEYSFAKGKPDLGDEPTVRIQLPPTLLEFGRRTHLTPKRLRVLIGPPNFRPLAVETRVDAVLPLSEHADPVRTLVSLCDGTRTLSEVVELAPGSETDVLGTVHALVLLGAVESAITMATEMDERGVTRGELDGVLKAAESADHYRVLGLEPTASSSEIRDAYYYLARRFHPDRFRTGPLHDVFEPVEAYFTKVTEAYNTLHDDERRAEFDRARAEPAAQGPEQDSGYLARSNYYRAKALIEKRRYQEAVKFLENAIQLDASNAEYHLELGRVLSLNPRHRSEAEERLLAAIDIDPTIVETYVALGHLYRRIGRDDEAADMYRSALGWDPNLVEAQGALKEMGLSPDDGSGGLLRGLFRG